MELGQHRLDNDQVEILGLEFFVAAQAIHGRHGLESLLEDEVGQGNERFLVEIHDQDLFVFHRSS